MSYVENKLKVSSPKITRKKKKKQAVKILCEESKKKQVSESKPE